MRGWRWCGGGGAPLPAERAGHALISGGSSGIGLALAHRLGEAGWDLTILARDRARLEAAQAALARHGRAVAIVSADVADAAAVAEAVDGSVRRLGPPSLVVACAGMVIPGDLEAQPADAFRRSMEVNYLGSLHLARAALPAMRAGGGRIVLVVIFDNRTSLGLVRLRQGRNAEGQPLLDQSLAILRSNRGPATAETRSAERFLLSQK